jgi:hypothetical protein
MSAEPELPAEDLALIDELADAIVRRHLGTPALFFVETMRPLGFVGSQMMVFLRPLVGLVWATPARWDHVQRILEVRGSLEVLARRLEARM